MNSRAIQLYRRDEESLPTLAGGLARRAALRLDRHYRRLEQHRPRYGERRTDYWRRYLWRGVDVLRREQVDFDSPATPPPAVDRLL